MKLEDLVLDELHNDEKLKQQIRGVTIEVVTRLLQSQENRLKLVLDQAVAKVYATDIEKMIKDSVKEVVLDIVRKQLENGNGKKRN